MTPSETSAALRLIADRLEENGRALGNTAPLVVSEVSLLLIPGGLQLHGRMEAADKSVRCDFTIDSST